MQNLEVKRIDSFDSQEELNYNEMQTTEGGFLPWLALAAAAAVLEGCTGCAQHNVPQHGAGGSY